MIDIHAHVLPGIDDGARNFDDSLDMIRGLSSCGVTDVIATPHYVNESIYVSSRSENMKLAQELNKLLNEAEIPVNVYLGNEIYIDPDILRLLKANKISTMAGSKHLLVELPLNDEYPNYLDYLQELLEQGYNIVLAHPERYSIVQDDYGVIGDLIEMGVLLQCNLGSITGKYGKEAKKVIRRIIKDKLVFAFGSDLHRPGREEELQLAMKKLAKYYNPRELEQVLVSNPKRLLGLA